MPAGPDAATARPPVRPPAIAIVGNDVLLAARPASAVQLTHGLMRLGFDAVVPASWGDELVANACVERCAGRGAQPAVLCACPLVAERLLASGADLSPVLIPLVTPAVAVARYLRRLASGTRPHIVFLGDCPGAVASEIDERLSPDETLQHLGEERIVLGEMPTVFESIIPADRRRTLSLPGGAPTSEALRRADPPRLLVELESLDLAAELAQHLLSGDAVLVDAGPRLGCACSGAGATGVPGRAGRAAVMALEPPRSHTSAVDLTVALDLDAPVRPRPSTSPPVPPARIEAIETGTPTPPDLAPLVRQRPPASPKPQAPLAPGRPEPRSGGRLRSPALGVPRFQGGSPPVSRTGEGRALPRAYVAHRRTPPNSRRVSAELSPPAGIDDPVPPPQPARSATSRRDEPRTEAHADAPVEPRAAGQSIVDDAPAPIDPPREEPRSDHAERHSRRTDAEPPVAQERAVAPPVAANAGVAVTTSVASVAESMDEGSASDDSAVDASVEERPEDAPDAIAPAVPPPTSAPPTAAGSTVDAPPPRPESSLAWLIREGPEAARVVPRYVPGPRAPGRRATIGIVATALLAVFVITVAWPRPEAVRSADGAVRLADSVGGAVVETTATPAATTRGGAAGRTVAPRQPVRPSSPRPASPRVSEPRAGAPAPLRPRGTGAGASRATSGPVSPAPSPAASAATPPASDAARPPVAAESTARPLPAAPSPTAASPDSAAAARAAELADIRRELDRRRARIDSIARSVESLPGRPQPPGNAPAAP